MERGGGLKAQLKMRVIKPKGMNKAAMMRELTGEMKDIQKDVRKDFDATTRTWKHDAKFENEFESNQRKIRFFTGTDDAIYGYVSGGTKPHIIRPKRAKALRFMGTYSAKTMPGVIGSNSGGSSGATVFSQGVQHPGTKARKFPEAVEKKWKRPFPKRIRAALDRAAKKSGHGKP